MSTTFPDTAAPSYTDHQVKQMPGLTIRIIHASTDGYGSPSGRLAEAEIIFDGPLTGLRLIGFGVWERRSPKGRRNVTFPARVYSVNGERRSFALLRPVTDINATDALRDAIVAAYEEHEQAAR